MPRVPHCLNPRNRRWRFGTVDCIARRYSEMLPHSSIPIDSKRAIRFFRLTKEAASEGKNLPRLC